MLLLQEPGTRKEPYVYIGHPSTYIRLCTYPAPYAYGVISVTCATAELEAKLTSFGT